MREIKKSYISPKIQFICLFVAGLIMTGCASMKPPVIQTFDSSQSIFDYRYFYITPTNDYTSSTGVYGNQYGMYGGITKTTNPSSVISGILIKNGFIQLNEINPDRLKETMIVNFGETGRRNVNLGYSIEITIQFISADSNNPICVCTAEGQGETEADDIRKAITRALEPLFNLK